MVVRWGRRSKALMRVPRRFWFVLRGLPLINAHKTNRKLDTKWGRGVGIE